MKRIWIAFTLIVIVIGTCTWGQITIKKAYENMSESFSKVADLCEKGNYEKAAEYGEIIISQWEKYFPSLSALKMHADLHDLMIDVNLINKYIEKKDDEEITKICDDAIIRLKHIYDGERISFGNIF